MASRQMIWLVEYYDYDGLWHTHGIFSSDENAKVYMDAAIADKDLGRDPESFRITWEYLDPEYI